MDIGGTDEVIDFGGAGITMEELTLVPQTDPNSKTERDQAYRGTGGNNAIFHFNASGR